MRKETIEGISTEFEAAHYASLETIKYNTHKNNLFVWNRKTNQLQRVRIPLIKNAKLADEKKEIKGEYQIKNNYTCYFVEGLNGKPNEQFVQHNYADGSFKTYSYNTN